MFRLLKSAWRQDQGMEVCFETNEQQLQSFYSHYSGTKGKEKMRIQETIENEMIEIIYLYGQFESDSVQQPK